MAFRDLTGGFDLRKLERVSATEAGGLVQERASDQFDDYVHAHIYQPANMTATGSQPEHQAVPDLSTGYTKPPGTATWVPAAGTLPWRGTSAGRRLLNGRGPGTVRPGAAGPPVAPSRLHAAADDRKVDIAPGGRYAYGFADLRDTEGNGPVGHDGGAPGMNGALWICPKSGYVVVALANMDPPAAQRIASWLGAWIPGALRSFTGWRPEAIRLRSPCPGRRADPSSPGR